MPHYRDHKFIVPQAVAVGPPMNTEDLVDKEIVVSGTFTATFDVQRSLDGVLWTTVVNNVNAPSTVPVAVSDQARFMRISVSAYTSGLPVVRLFGRNTRDG